MNLVVDLPVCDVVVAFHPDVPLLVSLFCSTKGEYVNGFCLQPFGTASLTSVELLLQILDTAYLLLMPSPIAYSSS